MRLFEIAVKSSVDQFFLYCYDLIENLSKKHKVSAIEISESLWIGFFSGEQLNNVCSIQVDELEAVFKKCKDITNPSNVELAFPEQNNAK